MRARKAPSATSQVDEGLKLAYEAAKDILKNQDTTLGNVRTRASNLLTVAALLTSFSVTLGLINTDPDKGFILPLAASWSLLVVLLLMGALVLFVLWPVRVWHFGPDAQEIFSRARKGQKESDIRSYVVQELITGIAVNQTTLRRKQDAFRWSVIVLLAEVAVLVGALSLCR